MERRNRPVFVMGCHRSGTNLLYDTLMSAGGFAVYRGYLPVYKMLIPRFGSLDHLENRKKLMETWLRSKGFRKSGLNAGELTAKVLRECRNGGDFIRITMEEVARQQNAIRWAVYDPDDVLYVREIKRDIPEALFLHIIRDGRDIALSLRKMGGFQPLPWDRGQRSLEATALYWEWMVRKGREHGREIPLDYTEVHYEELVSEPRQALARLSRFLDHPLDYHRIQGVALGRISEPNSSFGRERSEVSLSPVNRWKERLSRPQIAALEALVGECLEEVGYALTISEEDRMPGTRERMMRAEYFNFLDAKKWLKISTPAGRLANLSALELAHPGAAANAAPEDVCSRPAGRASPKPEPVANLPPNARNVRPMLKSVKRTVLAGARGLGLFDKFGKSEWRRDRLLILCYHGVSLLDEHRWDGAQYLSLTQFEHRCELLSRSDCAVLPLGEALERLRTGSLPKRSVALTFDDGVSDFYSQAYPVLKRHGFPATVYLTTYYCEYDRPVFDVFCSYLLWQGRHRTVGPDKRLGLDEVADLGTAQGRNRALGAIRRFARCQRLSAEAKDELARELAHRLDLPYEDFIRRGVLRILQPQQVSELAAAGVDFQLHTHRHRVPRSRDLFLREIEDNRTCIQQITGKRAVNFCYPSGEYRKEFIPWLHEAGVISATTCVPGMATRRSQPLSIPRLVDTSNLSDLEFEGWLTGVSSFIPRRRKTGHPLH